MPMSVVQCHCLRCKWIDGNVIANWLLNWSDCCVAHLKQFIHHSFNVLVYLCFRLNQVTNSNIALGWVEWQWIAIGPEEFHCLPRNVNDYQGFLLNANNFPKQATGIALITTDFQDFKGNSNDYPGNSNDYRGTSTVPKGFKRCPNPTITKQ